MVIPDIRKNKLPLIGGIVLVVVLAASPSIYFYHLYRDAQLKSTNPTAAAQRDAEATITAVGKLMVLPSDEVPTVALVSDISKLKDQQFFMSAKNGDDVLIYTQAKEAILYRPSINKIINVAPVNIGNSTITPTPTAAAPQTYTMVLRNGTRTVGLTKTFGAKVKTKESNLTISDYENAANTSYQKTIIVDAKGTNANEAGQIAADLGISVGPLPKGEATPSADFLIIVGADQK
jgi:hypothetical protein